MIIGVFVILNGYVVQLDRGLTHALIIPNDEAGDEASDARYPTFDLSHDTWLCLPLLLAIIGVRLSSPPRLSQFHLMSAPWYLPVHGLPLLSAQTSEVLLLVLPVVSSW